MDVSKDGKLLAYVLRVGGKDETEVHVLDVAAKRDLADVLPARVYFDVSFLPDGSGFYYATMLDDGPRVRFHKVGTKVETDTDVFGKGYAKEAIIVGDPSEDGQHLVLHVLHGSAADKVEIWVQDLKKTGRSTSDQGSGRALLWFCGGRPVVPAHELQSTEGPRDGARHGEAGTGELAGSGCGRGKRDRQCRAQRGQDPRDLCEECDLSGKSFSAGWETGVRVQAANPRIRLRGTGKVGESGGLFYVCVVRNSAYDLSLRHEKRRAVGVGAGKGPGRWVEVRGKADWYASKDGTKVPMFLVHSPGIKLDGSNPVLLEGYGGFMVNNTPYFNADAIVWAERGGVYALANLRGGGEFGEAWHKAGMLDKKQNVFDDFIAAAEWLIQNKYTNPSKLSILGGSNGGLLVGAALTQRPDLYQAVICWHPLLDMLRYDQFMEAQFWVSEYGAAKDPEQFKWLYAYSPYQHVKKGVKYPAVLFMSGDGDTRVAPLHARKMTALLQAETGSNRPILLRYELKAGHSGGRSLTQDIGDSVDELSFLFWQLGVAP